MKQKRNYIAPQTFMTDMECFPLMSGSGNENEPSSASMSTNTEVRDGTKGVVSLSKGYNPWDDEASEANDDDPWSDYLW